MSADPRPRSAICVQSIIAATSPAATPTSDGSKSRAAAPRLLLSAPSSLCGVHRRRAAREHPLLGLPGHADVVVGGVAQVIGNPLRLPTREAERGPLNPAC